MADSYKLTILKRLTALLEAIEPTPQGTPNQMPAIMTGLVFRGRNTFGDEQMDTFITILESPRQPTPDFTADAQVSKNKWPLLIQGFTKDDKIHPTDLAYGFLDDVEFRLDRIVKKTGSGRGDFPDDYMLGAHIDGNPGYLISDFEAGPAVVRPATDGISKSTFFWLPVSVGISRIIR